MPFPSSCPLALLITLALLAGCSRPVARFQADHTARYYTAPPTETSVADAAPMRPANVPEQPAAPQSAPIALVSRTPVPLATRPLVERLEQMKERLAASNKPISGQVVTNKKLTFVQRLALRQLDKKISKHLSPTEGPALTGYVRLGLILAAVGLLLLLIGNSLGALLGLLAVLGGLALVVVGLLQP